MLGVNLHKVTFNNSFTKQFWILTNDIVMTFHTFPHYWPKMAKLEFDLLILKPCKSSSIGM